jgi:hypothetical protein
MMQELLTYWPLAVFGQAMGVALAWNIDTTLWMWRRFEIAILVANLFGGIYLLVVALSHFQSWHSSILLLTNAEKLLIPPLCWQLIVTGIQGRQLKISLRTAFFAALMNSVVFACALHISSLLIVFLFAVVSMVSMFVLEFDASSGFSVFGLFYLGSATVSHALLALFRPTIYGTWHAWRQNSEKNRPMR